ncbi:ABC transporter permease [Lacticigenium naphthae]|uniref:ABC transporter permease n=1 Tax=Lacticigenium naphthae TaxID=515351 RepID=UPI0003FB18E3|nr:ABC transporter permease [Lacticigenium naphthae]
MWNVFLLQWKRLLKKPFLVFLFIGLTILFVYFMGGVQVNSTLTVPVYSESLTEGELDDWLGRLNEGETLIFEKTSAETAQEDIRMNEISFAMMIEEDNYQFLVGRDSQQIAAVDQHAEQIFREYNRLDAIQDEFPGTDIEVQEILSVQVENEGTGGGGLESYKLALLVGMTLYFSAYSVLFLQLNLIEEKRKGTWNRLIYSPVTKIQLYLGYLLHYFLVGSIQIIVSVFILTKLLQVDLGTNYYSLGIVIVSFIFATVSLGILLAALIPSPQSLQIVIPIVATSMAMLGGAFWTLEIVSNRFLLFIAELIPIKHGMDGMITAITQPEPLREILQPAGILVLMGILFMAIGINLMERVVKI